MANQSDSAQRAERMPQQQGAREVRVGLFVLVGAAALVALMFFLTDPATFRGRYKIQTEVENALGLRKGDPVQMISDAKYQFPLSVCIIYDYKNRGWRFH